MRNAALLASAVLFCTTVAHACSIPVFRYALDRWPADRFTLEVAPADAKDEKVAHFLRNFTDNNPLNLRLERLPDDSEEHSRLRSPGADDTSRQIWTGKLDAAAIKSLSGSPARAEIARRILAGDSAVWVVVTSGKTEADAAVAARVEKRLRYLEQIAQIPQIDPNDPSSKLGPGPALGVKFSMIRVNADAAAEKPFLTMLAGPNVDEMGNSGTWLAAVFGRGRVLGSWGARDFGDEQIDEISLFLLGACSCQVKRQNPGWDLVLDVDWDTTLQAMGVPPLPGTSEVPAPPASDLAANSETPAITPPTQAPAPAGEPATETVTIAPSEAAHSPAPEVSPATPRSRLALAAGALLIVGAGLTWRSRMKSP